MKISVRNRDPVLVAEVANKISKLFIQQNNAHNQEQFAKSTSFLLEQMEEKQEQLDQLCGNTGIFKAARPGSARCTRIIQHYGKQWGAAAIQRRR